MPRKRKTRRKKQRSSRADWPWIFRFLYGHNFFRYHIVPIFLIFGVFLLTHWMALIATRQSFSWEKIVQNSIGYDYGWVLLIGFYCHALITMQSPKLFRGPMTTFGFEPIYSTKGFLYYVDTMAIFCWGIYLFPKISHALYKHFDLLIGMSSTSGIILSLYLYFKGKYDRDHKNDVPEPAPFLYEFYRGMELHPKICSVDCKQWTNSRVGMMLWAIFATAFTHVYYCRFGYNPGVMMHYMLQMLYITKFYYWENGYFHTLDMMMDRAGFYLCWGCLAFLPAYFAFPNAYILTLPPQFKTKFSYLWGGLGIILTIMQYTADHQKHRFRMGWPETVKRIWGKDALFIIAEYKNIAGEKVKSPLLISGYWGVARHFNYFLEILISFCMSACLGLQNGYYTFSYFFLITPLVLHRLLRDEAKCSSKYGEHWVKYKERVPYALCPGLF